jgi:hypothetical protein
VAQATLVVAGCEKFLVSAGEEGADGARAHLEDGGDLLVGQVLRAQAEAFHFAGREERSEAPGELSLLEDGLGARGGLAEAVAGGEGSFPTDGGGADTVE